MCTCFDTFIKGDLPSGGWPENAGGPGAAAGLFDGIDLDWEYPTAAAGGNIGYGPEDRHNATLPAREFRRQLDVQGRAEHALHARPQGSVLPGLDLEHGRHGHLLPGV